MKSFIDIDPNYEHTFIVSHKVLFCGVIYVIDSRLLPILHTILLHILYCLA